MKKIISVFLSLNILMPNFACASLIQDELVKNLDKNLKINQLKQEKIEDELVKNYLNSNLKVQQKTYFILDDDLVKKLDTNLKIKKQDNVQYFDSIVKLIDLKEEDKIIKSPVIYLDEGKVKVSPRKYLTTRAKLQEGESVEFILAQDVTIKNKDYKKGTIIKARIETISQNKAYGVPADLIVGNFTLPNNTILSGQIISQGANRSLWVYPTGYLLTCFFLLGLPIFAIRGGHAKLKPSREYEIDI